MVWTAGYVTKEIVVEKVSFAIHACCPQDRQAGIAEQERMS